MCGETAPLKLEMVLYALSDPVRLHIVRNLAVRGELACYAAIAGLDGLHDDGVDEFDNG